MQAKDFNELKPGDIVSHAIAPWKTFIIVYRDCRIEKPNYIACQQSLMPNVININHPEDWLVIKKN